MSFFGATIHKLTAEGGYTVEEVDALTGPLIGLPKSASFRLVDIIGLDVWVHVLRNLHELAPHDLVVEAEEGRTDPLFKENVVGLFEAEQEADEVQGHLFGDIDKIELPLLR